MNFDDLKQTWQQQPAPPAPATPASEALAQVQTASRKFDRTIWWRDAREIGVGLVLIALFALPQRHATGSGWWQVLAVALLAFTTGYMAVARHITQQRRASFPATLLGELEWSIFHLYAQIRLLRSVTWWYLLPIFGSAIAFRLRLRPDLAPRAWLGWLAGSLLLNVAIYALNWFAARRLARQRGELLAQREAWRTLAQDSASSSPSPSTS